jgi:hypothetical protein
MQAAVSRRLRGPSVWLAGTAVVAGLGLDAVFLVIVARHFVGAESASSALLPLLLHLLAAGVAGFGQAALLARASCPRTLAFFTASALFVPGVGILGPLAALVVTRAIWQRVPASESIESIHPPELPERGPDNPRPPRLGAASAYGRLRHSRDSADRMGAVMAVRGISERSAVPVLRLALRDAADEVRLLAFSILQERERQLYAQIDELKAQLDGASANQVGWHAARLGQAYWELAYQELAQGELVGFVLDEAAKHVSAAIAATPTNPGFSLLLGRIRLRQGRSKEAISLLARAAELGLPEQVVKVHQAEAAFVERRFDEVRACLAAIPASRRTRPIVKHLVEYWA